jgi:hypothetical protein
MYGYHALKWCFLIKESAIATDALLPEFNSAPGANLP